MGGAGGGDDERSARPAVNVESVIPERQRSVESKGWAIDRGWDFRAGFGDDHCRPGPVSQPGFREDPVPGDDYRLDGWGIAMQLFQCRADLCGRVQGAMKQCAEYSDEVVIGDCFWFSPNIDPLGQHVRGGGESCDFLVDGPPLSAIWATALLRGQSRIQKASVSSSFMLWENGLMCGRFVQAHDAAFYADAFAVETIKTDILPVSYNVAPTDRVYAVAEHEGTRMLGSFRWGLIPWWAKDRKIGARHINARAETIAEKPAFRDSFTKRRCLIPADGFYEWQKRPKGKLPHYIRRTDDKPLAFAGLWSSWKDPDSGDKLVTCTIVTGRPNGLVADVHDRMPVILGEDVWSLWLDRSLDSRSAIEDLLAVHPEEGMTAHPVATLVNSVANNLPECIQPLESGAVEP